MSSGNLSAARVFRLNLILSFPATVILILSSSSVNIRSHVVSDFYIDRNFSQITVVDPGTSVTTGKLVEKPSFVSVLLIVSRF